MLLLFVQSTARLSKAFTFSLEAHKLPCCMPHSFETACFFHHIVFRHDSLTQTA